MVVLYDNEIIIGYVEYNNVLDYWDGRNYTNGGVGRHLGFGRLNDGRYYLIHGTQWQGEINHARIVSARTIVKEAIKSDNLREIEIYEELMDIYDKEFNKETVKSKTFSIRINIRESDKETEEKLSTLRSRIEDFKDLK